MIQSDGDISVGGQDLIRHFRLMQARFQVPEGFGMGRLVVVPEHTHEPLLASAAARDAAIGNRSRQGTVRDHPCTRIDAGDRFAEQGACRALMQTVPLIEALP